MDTQLFEHLYNILGAMVRDRVSGFTGVVVDFTIWQHSCPMLGVRGNAMIGGQPAPKLRFAQTELRVVDSSPTIEVRPCPADVNRLGEYVLDPVTGIEGTVTGVTVGADGDVFLTVEPCVGGAVFAMSHRRLKPHRPTTWGETAPEAG